MPVATPRLPQSVAAALAQQPMRSVQSEHLRLYFPRGREAQATRVLVDVERCASELSRAAQVHNGVADQKMVVLLPELPFNNAFVAPRLSGYDTEAVIPTFNTTAVFMTEMGQPPDPLGDRLSRAHPLRAVSADRRVLMVLERRLRCCLHHSSASIPGSTRAWPSTTRPS